MRKIEYFFVMSLVIQLLNMSACSGGEINNTTTVGNINNNVTVPLKLTGLSPTIVPAGTPGYQTRLLASGSNFNNVNKVTFNWSGSVNGTMVWNKNDPDWDSKVTVNSDNTLMTLLPVVTTSSDPVGTATWNVTITDTIGASASGSFMVAYNPPAPTPFTFLGMSPTIVPTGAPDYQTRLLASGSNFNNVNKVTFNWSGSVNGSMVWNKSDADWKSKVTVNSDNTIMTLLPVVTTSSDQAGITTWNVTMADTTGASATGSFIVAYNPPAPTPFSFWGMSPTIVPASTPNFQIMVVTFGSNFNNVNKVTFNWSGSVNGSMVWNKSDADWKSKVTVNSDNTIMTLLPVVTTSSDQPGTATWNVILTDTTGKSETGSFTVTYSPPDPTIKLKQNHVFCMGDSLTSDGRFESALQLKIGSNWIINNLGIPGNTTSQMNARFVDGVLAPATTSVYGTHATPIVIILGGINDIHRDTSAEEIEANLQAMYTAAHNAGLLVAAVTILPADVGGDVAARKSIVNSVNTWMSIGAKNVDYVIDAFHPMQDPNNPGYLLPVYDSGDHTHLSSEGYSFLGNYIYSKVIWPEIL